MKDSHSIPDLAGTIPGVNGAFLYEKGQGILTVQGNFGLQNSQLTEIAEKIVRNYAIASERFSDIEEMFIRFRNITLFVCRIARHRWLHVFYDPAMTQVRLQHDIRQALHSQGLHCEIFSKSAPSLKGADQWTGESESLSYTDMEALLTDQPELKQPLEVIRDELMAIIGPIAEVVFDDAVNEWLRSCRPSRSSLGKLAEIIEVDIGTADMINSFRTRLLNRLDITRII